MTHMIRADRETEPILLPYEVCIKLTEHKDHNIVTSSLETLAQLLRNAPPPVVYNQIEAEHELSPGRPRDTALAASSLSLADSEGEDPRQQIIQPTSAVAARTRFLQRIKFCLHIP